VHWLLRIYNGGLDPDDAEHGALRERRAVSVTALAASLIAVAVLILNAWRGNWAELPLFASLLPLGPVVLVLLPRIGRPRLLAQPINLALMMVLVASMADSGLTGIGWMWLVGVPLVATLMSGRLSGAIWTLLAVVVVLAFFGLHLVDYPFPSPRGAPWRMVGPQASLFILAVGALSIGLVTAQLRTEAGLQRQLDRARAAVHTHRAAEERAQAAARRARRAEQAKDQFLATVSHELRTPMNGVIGATRLLERTTLDPEQEELLRTVRSSGELLMSLVDDVLDFSRVESGQASLEQLPVDLPALVREVARPLAWTASERGVDVRVQVDPALPRWVEGDPTRLRQILLNLAGNAVKFTHQGHVTLRALPHERGVRLQVQDTGIGISAQALDRIFEPFVQADATTVRRFGGTGLGLSIVRRFADLMGGRVTVQSTPGQGSTFTVDLPLAACEAPTRQPPPPPAPSSRIPAAPPRIDGAETPTTECARVAFPPSGAARVLLVDDNAVNRLVARKMLEKLGHQVVEAASGAEALDQADDSFDVVFMDVQMPGMDGLEATRRLRAGASTAELPIIGLSANVRSSDRERGLQAGMRDYLGKPVSTDTLDQAVRSARGQDGSARHQRA